jgi:protein ImuB
MVQGECGRRIRRDDPAIPDDRPIAVIASSGAKRWVSAADKAARQIGVSVGMPAAKAQAIFRGLMLVDGDHAADALALDRLGLWALGHYSPIVAVDGIDGLVLDTEGADHLQGGEQPMITGIVNMFRARKLTARVAIADTWGAAHACVRAIRRDTVIVPRGEIVRAVEKLPTLLAQASREGGAGSAGPRLPIDRRTFEYAKGATGAALRAGGRT